MSRKRLFALPSARSCSRVCSRPHYNAVHRTCERGSIAAYGVESSSAAVPPGSEVDLPSSPAPASLPFPLSRGVGPRASSGGGRVTYSTLPGLLASLRIEQAGPHVSQTQSPHLPAQAIVRTICAVTPGTRSRHRRRLSLRGHHGCTGRTTAKMRSPDGCVRTLVLPVLTVLGA